MSEQELKLHVPASARPGVSKAVDRQATRIRLHAQYFDTPDRELARARIALRLRLEGDSWMQTLKMPGANSITRIELNHPRHGPELDLSVYTGTEFEAPLSSLQGELSMRYETDVERLLRNVQTPEGTIELAYDTGVLRARSLELPISELEFELIEGDPAAIFSVARRWQRQHGLVLDARSKSERGDALASLAQQLAEIDASTESAETIAAQRTRAIADFWAPRPSQSVVLEPGMTPHEAMARIADECLDQIIRNAATLAEVDTLGIYPAGRPEHLHQLRVAMRRLRSAWRLMDGWITPPPPSVLNGARKLFGQLGQGRDRDVLIGTVLPMLQRAGMPAIEVPEENADFDTQAFTAGPQFQRWLLDTLAWSVTVQTTPLTADNAAGDQESPAPISTACAAAMADAPATSSAAAPAQSETLTEEATPEASSQSEATSDRGLESEDSQDSQHRPEQETAQQALADQAQDQPPADDLAPVTEGTASPALADLLTRRLQRWHKQVVKQGKQFASLDLPTRHELRKRGKRLRYGLTFAQSLLPQDKASSYGKKLSQLQDVLGEINDLAVANDRFEAWSDKHPQAWFALGWIRARLDHLTTEAQAALDDLGSGKPLRKRKARKHKKHA
ncbi:CYTH and CHAD domain-containing protein [Bordetella sp. 02P26C-1]|uniref:CYTH and CHAD domain-containing protein n=1 Tax=Bordetella sp. 02P26C-1 TaxID=2683195 RepID=UPI001354AB94|nr:CYTH and CHAD domain-containing protein [Bordetella sp. 02P26C-1]MVW80838.1 CHAD domain-containing protein [Bordetella sp. 02P26C-1]